MEDNSIIHGIPEWEHPKQMIYNSSSSSSSPSTTTPSKQYQMTIQPPPLQRAIATSMIQHPQRKQQLPSIVSTPLTPGRSITPTRNYNNNNNNNMDHIHRLNREGLTPNRMMISFDSDTQSCCPSVGDITWDQTEIMAFDNHHHHNNNMNQNNASSDQLSQQQQQHPWENFKEIDDNDIVHVVPIQRNNEPRTQQQQQHRNNQQISQPIPYSQNKSPTFASPSPQRRKNRVFAIPSSKTTTGTATPKQQQPPQKNSSLPKPNGTTKKMKAQSPLRPLSPARTMGVTANDSPTSSRKKDSPLRKLLSRKKLTNNNNLLLTPLGFGDDDRDINHPLSSASDEFIMTAVVAASTTTNITTTLAPKDGTIEISVMLNDQHFHNSSTIQTDRDNIPADVDLTNLFQQKKLYKTNAASINNIVPSNDNNKLVDVAPSASSQQQQQRRLSSSFLHGHAANNISSPVPHDQSGVVSPPQPPPPQQRRPSCTEYNHLIGPSSSKQQRRLSSSLVQGNTATISSLVSHEPSVVVSPTPPPPQQRRPNCTEYNHLIGPVITSPARKSNAAITNNSNRMSIRSNSVSTIRASNTGTNGFTKDPASAVTANSTTVPSITVTTRKGKNDDSMLIKAITTSPKPIPNIVSASRQMKPVDMSENNGTTAQRATTNNRRYHQKVYLDNVELSIDTKNESKDDCDVMDVSQSTMSFIEPRIAEVPEPIISTSKLTLQQLDDSIQNLEWTLQQRQEQYYCDDDDRSVEFNERLVNLALDCSLAFVNDDSFHGSCNSTHIVPPMIRNDSFRFMDLQTAMALSSAIMDD